jgi:hypothetical protein
MRKTELFKFYYLILFIMNMNKVFVLFKDKLISIERENEPNLIFVQRIDFILKGLLKNIDEKEIIKLSLHYKNIIQYGVKYDPTIHLKIENLR